MRGMRHMLGLLMPLLAGSAATSEAQRPPSGIEHPPNDERVSLGAAFTGANPRGLAHLLHGDLIVQPPEPDSAVRGSDALAYLMGLAAATHLDESRLRPHSLAPEGRFVLEQGTWVVRMGDRALSSRYHLRWRRTPAGWKIVLLRWTRFS